MKKILFATYRNILTTSGELRLIKNRAESLFNENKIITDFIAFAKKSRINQRNETINAGGNMSAYEISFSNVFTPLRSYFGVRNEIKETLKSDDYRAVVLSGPAMGFFAKRIKKCFQIPIIADIHGTLEDTLEYAKTCSFPKNIILNLYYHCVEKPFFKRSLKYIDAFFVVTDALKEYLKTNYHIKDNTRFFIIPCATENRKFSIEEHLKDRKQYRNKFGINDNEIVFVYSGGVSSWQCVDKTIDLFKKIADNLNQRARMFVFSHRKDYFEKLIGGDNRIQIDSYPPEELLHVLHAGDFAFLLRENSPTNNVAFPNKYLEYIQSGMKIITTPYVNEIARQISESGRGFIYDFDMDIQKVISYVQNTDRATYDENGINEILTNNSFSKTTKSFCEWFKKGTDISEDN